MKIITDITREDYADYARHHFFKKGIKRSILFGIVALVGMELMLNSKNFSLRSSIVAAIFLIGVYVFLIYRNLNKTRNIPDENGTILGRKELEFADDKIYYKTAYAEGHYKWSAISTLSEGSTSFYLYLDNNVAILVPKRAFSSDTEQQEFRALIQRKIAKA